MSKKYYNRSRKYKRKNYCNYKNYNGKTLFTVLFEDINNANSNQEDQEED